jgi:D-alanine-D-alanine ligase
VKIAIVRNSQAGKVIARFGQVCPEVYAEKTIVSVACSLREAGHEAAILEGDTRLFAALEAFLPPDGAGKPTGLVFNMAYGIQGECRYTHVPALLETAGIPYTGSSPFGHALALDKVVTKQLMIAAGVPTPRYAVLGQGSYQHDLRYPLVVKPRHESTSFGLALVHDESELRRAVDGIVETYHQLALVEEYIDGREAAVGLLGNDPVECLPIVEQDFRGRARKIVTWEDKFHKVADEPVKICPAPLDEALARRLREISVATFRACHCRDYARVDIRIDAEGNPYVLEINSMASLGPTGSYVIAAQSAGYSFTTLVDRIVEVACLRYGRSGPETSIASGAAGRAA